MTRLSPAELSFRVAIGSLVLGVIGYAPGQFHIFVGALLTLAALAFFWEAISRRKSRLALRMNLLWGMFAAAGAMVLVIGLAKVMALPLIGLAVVCAVIGIAGRMSEPDDEDSETEH